MKEQTRIRLELITQRHAKRAALAAAPGDSAAAFAREAERRLAEIVRPAMEEIGAELLRAGHGARVDPRAPYAVPTAELHLVVGDAPAATPRVIRFFVRDREPGCPEVVAELEITRHPMELTRFPELERITTSVVEQLLVDAVEHVFACAGG